MCSASNSASPAPAASAPRVRPPPAAPRRRSPARSSSSPAPVAEETASTPSALAERCAIGSAARPRRRQQVALRDHDELGQPLEPGAVRGELAADRLVGVARVALLDGSTRDQVDEHPAALDVGEELVAEPGARRRALDQPGDVGEHQLALAVVDRPQHRLERRERIVGDLRRSPASARPAATTCRRSAARRARRRRAASAAARSSPTRPASPRSANRGACRVELAKRLLPCPPSAAARRPPRAGPARPGRSARRSSPSTCVPGGTRTTSSSPRAPWRCLPWPWPPRPARWWGEKRSAARSRRDGSQTRTTSPPRPPSPPSGPPRGTCASRRKLTTPLPPAPALDVDLRPVAEASDQR